MPDDNKLDQYRLLAESLDDIRTLHQMCREGRLYDVEQWIAEGKPLQIAPEFLPKSTRPKTALQIAIETGQHSLAFLLLGNGYRLELERCAPLDLALQARRWDLVDLLLEWGVDKQTVDVYTILNTYNVGLYEQFWAAGCDLTERHEMGAILGLGTSNRPLLGFVKRHRTEDSRIQQELNIALGYHARVGNEKGVNLCLWAGADSHTPAPNPQLGWADDTESDDVEERFKGWSAIEEAAREGHLTILKQLGPDPQRDNFDNLYKYAKYGSIIAFLSTIHPPGNLTSILSWHLMWLTNPLPWGSHMGTENIEALLASKARWEKADPAQIAEIRRMLLKTTDYGLKTIMSRLKRIEVCASETYTELIRTPRMQTRLLALGLMKKPVSEKDKRKDELARLMRRYDRAALYQQVWSQPVQEVAKSYGISDVRLGKVCRILQVPAPPRGYWARVRNGYTAKKPPLAKISGVASVSRPSAIPVKPPWQPMARNAPPA